MKNSPTGKHLMDLSHLQEIVCHRFPVRLLCYGLPSVALCRQFFLRLGLRLHHEGEPALD